MPLPMTSLIDRPNSCQRPTARRIVAGCPLAVGATVTPGSDGLGMGKVHVGWIGRNLARCGRLPVASEGNAAIGPVGPGRGNLRWFLAFLPAQAGTQRPSIGKAACMDRVGQTVWNL